MLIQYAKSAFWHTLNSIDALGTTKLDVRAVAVSLNFAIREYRTTFPKFLNRLHCAFEGLDAVADLENLRGL